MEVLDADGAVFNLELLNQSDTGKDLEHFIHVESKSIAGAKVNRNDFSLILPYNQKVVVPLIVTKDISSDKSHFDEIKVYLGDPCEFGTNKLNSFYKSSSTDSIVLQARFKKSCSKVRLSSPQNNWVFNRFEAFKENEDGTKKINKLPIQFTDFNTDFAGFQKIVLEYRNTNAASWTKFKTYYGSVALKDAAGDDEGVVITDEFEFDYNWDVVGDKIPDGDYEIRAVAYCENGENGCL